MFISIFISFQLTFCKHDIFWSLKLKICINSFSISFCHLTYVIITEISVYMRTQIFIEIFSDIVYSFFIERQTEIFTEIIFSTMWNITCINVMAFYVNFSMIYYGFVTISLHIILNTLNTIGIACNASRHCFK